jgi:hypothetical protein
MSRRAQSLTQQADPDALDEHKCRSTGGMKFDANQPSRQHLKGVLEHCSKYVRNSCCNATHNLPLKRMVLEPLVANFNKRCQEISEEMVCSACHPYVGTGRMDRICPDMCDEWFDACKEEFYTASSMSQSLTPCYGNALVCSPLKDIVSS